MNVFQGLVLMLFSLLSAVTLSAAIRGMIRKRIAVFWLAIWTLGGLAIIWPRSTMLIARYLGIGRGADLLLYLSVLLMLVGFFYVYGRFRRLDRQITLLVRRLAIEHTELRSSIAPPPPSVGSGADGNWSKGA
jgi:small membrane protein